MNQLNFTPISFNDDGTWQVSEKIDIDASTGVTILPYERGDNNGTIDPFSEIRVNIMDPVLGITGEDVHYAYESPALLIAQL